MSGLRFDDARADVHLRRRIPCDFVATEPRKQPGAVRRVRGVRGIGHQRDAFVGAERIDDLDTEPVAVAGDHLRIERRRPRPDAAQAGQVDAREQLLVLEQHVQHRGRCDRVLRPLLGDLPQIDAEVERVMQHERAGAVQPAHEAAADRGHVDQRERIEQPLAALDARPVEVAVADRDPVIVGAGHAFRHAFGARRPADRGDVVRRHVRVPRCVAAATRARPAVTARGHERRAAGRRHRPRGTAPGANDPGSAAPRSTA